MPAQNPEITCTKTRRQSRRLVRGATRCSGAGYVNKEWCEFNRKTEDAVLGRTIVEVLGEEVFGIDKEQAERALAGEIVHRDGWGQGGRGWRYVQTTFAPVRDAAGSVKAGAAADCRRNAGGGEVLEPAITVISSANIRPKVVIH
jgi:PAS fold